MVTYLGFNPLSSEVHKKCYKNGTCRYECYGSEMLVAYCMYKLECCVTGDPGP
ncbi:beta-defensin 134 [Callospermophilus lateralis]|uniref:beta-defensin 134 n=1 Tax=Callospermophilus lateralis TaxID=76772 RepID=UPI0040384F71